MDTTRATRAALALALLCFLALVVKNVVMAAAGGVGRTWWENPPFYAALLLGLVSLALTLVAAVRGRTWRVWLGTGAAMLVLGVAAAAAGALLVGAVQPADPGWIWGELDLFTLPLSALALALLLPRWRAGQVPGRAGAGRGPAGTLGV